MLVAYNEMSADSRVWVYQSTRHLSDIECNEIMAAGADFVTQWTAHNNELKACFTIKYNRFLILLVDESHNDASGCSIDKSVRFVQQTEQKYNIELMNRMNFAYKQDAEVLSCNKLTFEELYKNGKIQDDTLVFNNLIATKQELEQNWELPLRNSWHKQIINA